MMIQPESHDAFQQRIPQWLNELLAVKRPYWCLKEASKDVELFRNFYKLPLSTFNLGNLQSREGMMAVHHWPSPTRPKGIIIMLHGLYDHHGLYRHAIEWAHRLSWDYLGVDLPGHGLSSGVRATISSFTQYQNVITDLERSISESQLPIRKLWMGFSMGGGLLLERILQKKISAPWILLAPLIRPRAWRQAQLGHQLLRHFGTGVKRRFYLNTHDDVYHTFVHQQDPLQSHVLSVHWIGAMLRWSQQLIQLHQHSAVSPKEHHGVVIQGDADLTLQWKYNLNWLQQRIPNLSTALITDLRHQILNETPELRTKVWKSIENTLCHI